MQILKHEGVRRYASNTLWLFAENVLRLISGILIGVWVTRYLGPEKYGVISYALAFVAIFSTIAKVGLDSIVIRDLVNHPEKKTQYLGTAFWLKLIGSLFTIIVVGVLAYFSPNSSSTNLYILVIASGLIFQSYEVIDFYYQSQVKSKYVSISKIIQLVLSGVIKLYLIYIHADVIYFVLTYLLEQFTLALLLYLAYNSQKHESFSQHFNSKIAKSLLLESWPVIIVGIAITIQSKIDQVILGSMLGSTSLGFYALAISFIEIISFLPVIINSSITPAIINAKKRSTAEYLNRLQSYYSMMFILSVIIGLPITLFGSSLTVLIYGDQFLAAGTIFSLLALRIFFANMGVARSQYIVNEKLLKFNLLTTMLGAAVSIMMNFYLIPIYGVTGAIIASYFSFFVSTFLIDLFYSRTRENLVIMFKGIVYSYQLFSKNLLS
jgi:O-antigen/teichoic acid export membrane protein